MATKDWQLVSLRDLIEIKHGFAFKGEFFRDNPTRDILLTPGNFAIGGGFKDDKLKYYAGPVPSDYILEEGDLIVTMTDLSKDADTLGFPAFVPKSLEYRYLHNQRLGKIIIRSGVPLKKDYLYFLLCSRPYRNEVLASATGTTVKHTSPERIEALKFLLPPLPEQEGIANMLGILNDKIELNRQMNKTLGAIAKAIYKSWFVDFDPVRTIMEGRKPYGMDTVTAALFPGSFEDSALGKIPKGWSIKNLPEIMDINPQRSLRKGQSAPYLEMSNMPNSSARALDWAYRDFSSGMKFMNGDVLLARITPCLENGKTAYVDFLADGQVGWGSTEYIVFSSKPPLPKEYAYFLARSDELRTHAIQNMTGTSGRQRVPAECFKEYPIVVPPEKIAVRFGEIVRPFMLAIKQYDEESRTLAAIRDALLPKLLSGEIRVKDAEKHAEALL